MPSAVLPVSAESALRRTPRLFDLNIEEVLDNWEVTHAIREVISNALDEQNLSRSSNIVIESLGADRWRIRDFGRGLRIEHFTLNENKEKLASAAGVIGKFGVGLKDALATFHRRGVGVEIESPFGTFTLRQSAKHDFSDIATLHVSYDDDPLDIVGTQFVLSGVTTAQMADAKALFLRFNDEKVLESTKFGDILRRRGPAGRVYISGVFAAEEPNFLFSYNVTHLTDAMKKRLNRERLNVGRTTYAERIKQMLRTATSEEVVIRLTEEIRERGEGSVPDELTWIEIAQMALTHLHEAADVLFVTDQELQRHPDVMDNARHDGLEIVVITSAEKGKLVEQAETGGTSTRLLESYVMEFNDSFEYRFVEPEELTPREREVLALTQPLFELVGVDVRKGPKVLISETMRLTGDDTEGVWDTSLKAIVVKRSKLRSARSYAGTLLHELAHATSGTVDATRAFESVLTRYLGRTSTAATETPVKGTAVTPVGSGPTPHGESSNAHAR